jgi:antitoxin component of MazEF toxin-antitoxin module
MNAWFTPCMVALKSARIGEVGSTGAKLLRLPKAWVDGVGIRKGQEVEILFDDVLLVIPKSSAQALRVRRAMEEG